MLMTSPEATGGPAATYADAIAEAALPTDSKIAGVEVSKGAEVDERIYPGLGHTVIDDEIDAARRILEGIPAAAARREEKGA